MDIVSALPFIQIALVIILVFLVIIQKSEAGAGGAFGGGDQMGATQTKRRGPEKIIFGLTIIVAILFVASVLASTYIQI